MLPRGPEDAAEGRRAGVFSAVLIQGDCLPLRGLGNKRLCRRSMGKGGDDFEGCWKRSARGHRPHQRTGQRLPDVLPMKPYNTQLHP